MKLQDLKMPFVEYYRQNDPDRLTKAVRETPHEDKNTLHFQGQRHEWRINRKAGTDWIGRKKSIGGSKWIYLGPAPRPAIRDQA